MQKCIVIIIFMQVIFYWAAAQPEIPATRYRAVHWGLEQGLSQGETYHMIKDVNGFLWIGTRLGLNRFDGNSFKVYTHQRNNNKSLIANDAWGGFIEDSLHNIWIGSNEGLSRYNTRTDDFTNFFCDTTFNDYPEISPFWATKNEVFCIESESLITAYNIHSSAKKIIGNLGNYKHKIIGIATTYSIFDSVTNSVWCLVENEGTKAGLLQIMLSTGEKMFFPFIYKRKENSQGFAEDMCYDAVRKCIWINSTEGLLQFTLADKQFHHITALYKYEQLKNYNRFVGITLDKQNRIWFSTHSKGIIVYNPADESVSFPFPADSAIQHDISDANCCIYFDRDNIIWSGFWLQKGIYALIPYFPVIKHYTASPDKNSLNSDWIITAVYAGKGKVWAGTGKGINILDTKTGTFQSMREKDLPGIKTQDSVIGPIAIDTIGQKAFLFTCWSYWPGDFFKEDMVTKKCTRILVKNLDNEIIPLEGSPVFDGKEIFFFDKHISVLNLNDDTAHEILSVSDPYYLINSVPVKNHFLFLQGYTDEKGNMTYENRSGKWVLIHTPIDSMRWTSIGDINDGLWVAGENKLFHFDIRFHLIQTYSAENGLPELPISGLINDNNGNIWFHTDRLIHELNVSTGQIKTMSEIEGFEKQNFDLLQCTNKDANGNIYYCGGTFGVGFNRINPGNFISTISSVYLKSLSINQKPFPLKASMNYTDTLSLRYNQTKIEIEMGIIDFYSNGKSRIRYRLEGRGLHENWQYAPYYYTIRYDGLKPGNYKLVMQSSNISNEFNGIEKVLFIDISPAFWDTWWFRIINGICLIALIYGFIRWRLNQKFQQQLQQSEKEKQFAELKNKSSELEMQALRSQMNPHFIFNCLSSINSFILKNETEPASDYLTKFSRLIRMVLNNSKETFITLEDELEMLELYLDLERLRFKNLFGYNIRFVNPIEVDDVFIPPLLIQPFAENAIWHGLMHKGGAGHLEISLSVEEKILTCIIADDGIGRSKAAILKSKSVAKQKSLGLQITKERLALLNHDEDKTSVSIEDIKDYEGNNAGTNVILKIHYKNAADVLNNNNNYKSIL